MDSLIHQVEELLREVAEREVMTRFRRLSQGDIRHKQREGDLVTVADLEAEHHIRAGLLNLMPDSIVVGEEAAYKKPAILDQLNGETPVWVVDPIDGTRNYATGKACFAVMCALVVKGETRMGWILDPVSGACAVAEKGEGAYVLGRRAHVKAPDGEQYLCGSVGDRIKARLQKRHQSGEPRVPGAYVRYHCVGREYMDIALGKIHFGYYGGRLMPWDHAGGCLIVEEAGGVALTTHDAQPYDPAHHAHGGALLVATDRQSFDTLCPILSSR